MKVEVFSTPDALAAAAADAVASAADFAVARHGRFLWCLAGGATPRALYEAIASEAFRRRVRWPRTHVFFGDERCVPPADKASNYRMACEALLDHVPLPARNIHRIEAEHDPAEAAVAYERTLRSFLGVSASGAPAHGFDLVLLGMGEDGHTASLFPHSVDEPNRWVSARQADGAGVWRVTVTPMVFNAAEAVRFLVEGAKKAERLEEVLEGAANPELLPAQRIQPYRGELVWMVDRPASAGLLQVVGGAGRVRDVPVEVRA